MGAIADFGRALRAVLSLDDVRRLEAVAGDLLDRLVEHLAVVGQVDGQRRRPGGDDAEHVALVDQGPGDALEQVADAAGVAEVEMQIVDDDEEDAAGGVVARPRRGQDDAFLRRRWRGRLQVEHPPAMDQRHRRHLLLDAVLVDLDFVLAEVGHELIAGIAHDDVGRDQIDGDAEVGRRRLRAGGRWRRRRRRGRRLGLTGGGHGRGSEHDAEREPGTGSGESAVAHTAV